MTLNMQLKTVVLGIVIYSRTRVSNQSVLLLQWQTIYGTQFEMCASVRFKHTTHRQPFYGSMDLVWDNPGEPVPEETFTHSN